MIPLVIITIVLLALALAKAKPKRKFRRYLKGQVNQRFDLGTLAGATLVSAITEDTVTETAWLSSFKAIWTLSDMTLGADIGPIVVGIAHSDYTDAEIEAWYENTSSWEVGDQVAQEIAKRKCRTIGTFSMSEALPSVSLNDGKPIRTKCGWRLDTGQGVRMWAYNAGSNALATTVPNVSVDGHANLWPF